MKRVRVAPLLAAAATGILGIQAIQAPIHAASASAEAGLAPARQADTQSPANPGAASYARHCAICHGDQREGNLPAFPPLLGIAHQKTSDQIAEIVHFGKGRMPGFPALQSDELKALLHFLTSSAPSTSQATAAADSSALAEAGGALFLQNCAFCHGRDAMGGESGPDLTQSELVLSDATGKKISAVVENGRPAKKMPAFKFSSHEIDSLVAFIRARTTAAASQKGGRRGVAVADLQTGDVQAGMRYFNGAGGCAKCHSPSGDLAGIATRYRGLELEERMLYPEDARSKVTVTLPSAQRISGTLAYLDEFTVGLRDSSGVYKSWPTKAVKYTVDSPVDAHVDLFSKYTDDDIHNLMAYIQTLR